MEQVKIGVIGLGMGKAHIRGYMSHPRADVTAIADPDAGRLEAVGNEFGIAKRYSSAEEMLGSEDLDVVSVATPNVYHKSLTILSMENGCHVLCEKPMAMNAAEAREMLDAAERYGKRLMINFSFRFTAQSEALKRQIEKGALGEIYFGRTVWHRRRGFPRFGGWFGIKELSGGGPLIDLGVHRLDLALWLMGYPKPVWVMAGTFGHLGRSAAAEQGVSFDVEDLAAGTIRFENGAVLQFEASWAAHIAEKELMETRLLGTKGGIVQRNLDEGYEFEAHLYHSEGGDQYDVSLHPPRTQVPSAMNRFVESIVNDLPHPATGEQGYMVMQILDAIYKSAELGEPVRI